MPIELLMAARDAAEHGALTAALDRAGFHVAAVSSRAEFVAAARAGADAVLVDERLDDVAGTQLCRALRADPLTRTVPILLLCEGRDEIDRVVGLEVGADDVVPKPYSVRELVLRISAVVRRGGAKRPAAPNARAFQLDAAERRVLVDGVAVPLTRRELRLLQLLLERPDRVLSREVLIAHVGAGGPFTERAVDACVKRLREKLGPAGKYLQTVRGVGYRFSTG
jgi:two-component system, OmpR family, phosphate regulon response regulator PhoB